MMETRQKEPTSKYLNYGMPRLGASSILTLIDMGMFSLYTTGYGVSTVLAGFALGMGKLAIAASQFLLGWLSDTTKTRFGKRKPYMITLAPVLGIAFMLLCLPTVFIQNPSMMDLFWWLLIFDLTVQFVYGGLTTPYQSWMAEKFDVHERPKASAFQNLFGMLGVAVAVIIVFLVLPKATTSYSTTGILTTDFIIVILVIGIMVIALFYLCTLLLSTEEQKETKVDFIADVKFILKDKNFMKICLLQGIAFLAWGMVTPTLIDFVTIVLGFEGNYLYIAAALLFLGIMAFLFTWLKLINKKGKKSTIGIIFLLAVVVLPFSLIGLLPNIPFAVALIYTIGVAACLAGWYLFPYIWYADLAEDAKQRGDLDDMKAGLYAGFPNVLLNIFQAVALIITGLILDLPNVPGQTYSYGYVIWGVWCSGVLLIGYIYIKKYITLDFDWEKEVKQRD